MIPVTFDEKNHRYIDERGNVIPHWSHLAKHFGLVDYSMVDKATLESSAKFGRVVHETCAMYDMGELASCDPEVEPYLDGWKRFLSDLNPKFKAIEIPLASRVWGFAGTPDRVYKVSRDGILDIKTGAPVPVTDLQTAAYQILVEENLGLAIKERITIKLVPGEYRLIQHKDRNDINTVKGMLALYRWKCQNGLIKGDGE